MMCVEKEAKTVDDAIADALADLGISRDQAEIEILVEPSSGFFGIIGTRPARVRVRSKKIDGITVAKDFLQDIFRTMGIPVSLEKVCAGDQTVLNLCGEDLGILIGKHGQTLDALQFLTNLVANKNSQPGERIRIVVDIEDYRRRRSDTLRRLAFRLADRVKCGGDKIVLEPMTSHERKIIHTCLQNDRRINTSSEGDEPYRKVVISLRRNGQSGDTSMSDNQSGETPSVSAGLYRRRPIIRRSKNLAESGNATKNK